MRRAKPRRGSSQTVAARAGPANASPTSAAAHSSERTGASAAAGRHAAGAGRGTARFARDLGWTMPVCSDTLAGFKPARHGLVAVACVCCALVLTGCAAGGSPGRARALVGGAFGAGHHVVSGRLTLALSLAPAGEASGGSTLALDIAGPFEGRGPGRIPAWSFTLTPRVGERSITLGLVCTGTAAYVTAAGGAYRLPAVVFARLAGGFARVAAPDGHAAGILGRLGLDPLRWITHPRVVTPARMHAHGAGATKAPIIEIRAGVRPAALLRALKALLARAQMTGADPSGQLPTVSAFTLRRIVADARGADFDLWVTATGHVLRRMQLVLILPVGGALSRLLGGARTAQAQLSLQYRDLNVPQRISAPAHLRPYGQLPAQLVALASRLLVTAKR